MVSLLLNNPIKIITKQIHNFADNRWAEILQIVQIS